MQNEKKKIIVGLDLSLASSGICIMNGDTGEVIAYDNLPTKEKDFRSDEHRFYYIANCIVDICKNYHVTHVAIEDSFNGVNPKVGKKLARLYGAVACMLYENGFTLIYSYIPASWRKSVCGAGNKTKEGVYNYVCKNIIDIGIPFDIGINSIRLFVFATRYGQIRYIYHDIRTGRILGN